ncbi:hypothetical protein AOLI_G00049820 [Acnodon oligacanthus]
MYISLTARCDHLADYSEVDSSLSSLKSGRRAGDGGWREGSERRLAEPETQLLALIDFSDGEDFPIHGPTPPNPLRSLLAEEKPHPHSLMPPFNPHADGLAQHRDQVWGKVLAAALRL